MKINLLEVVHVSLEDQRDFALSHKVILLFYLFWSNNLKTLHTLRYITHIGGITSFVMKRYVWMDGVEKHDFSVMQLSMVPKMPDICHCINVVRTRLSI